ncbi:MAG TPA: hypothetical protein VG650_15445 [Mycobacteriales bacterium]|nr:hypothetical protein [Mycobacteriales bacterium]
MTRGTHATRPSRFWMPRRRGAVAGPLIMLLGAWGALIPFFGHSFGYGYTPSNTWTWTAARGWLELLPGAGAFVGGAILTASGHRAAATLGGWLAAASGSWFVLGTIVTPWWNPGYIGTPVGNASLGVWERIGMFTGVGMAILYLAAVSLGRISLSGARDLSTSPEQLEAMRRIEGARTIPGERPKTVDLTAAEAGTDARSESIQK